MLWQHGQGEVKQFLEILNTYHPTINFTAIYSRKKISFLDVEVIKNGNQRVTDLYMKPGDTCQYLYASSCHIFIIKAQFFMVKP